MRPSIKFVAIFTITIETSFHIITKLAATSHNQTLVYIYNKMKQVLHCITSTTQYITSTTRLNKYYIV